MPYRGWGTGEEEVGEAAWADEDILGRPRVPSRGVCIILGVIRSLGGSFQAGDWHDQIHFRKNILAEL